MSDAPDWSDIPPPEYGPQHGGGSGRGRGRGNAAPAMTPEELAAAGEDFYDWLEHADTLRQLKIMLPDHVQAPVFIATAKTAVVLKPQLLRADLRPSLLTGVMRAASMGLLPDGKQGALVPRYNADTKTFEIAWQPMVWGVVKLGRETGAIRSIRAVLVFNGEPFRIIQGEEDRIEHEVDPDIVDAAYAALNGGRDGNGAMISKPDAFIAHLRAAYCLITATDGTITRRWMTRQRLISLWQSTRAEKGPWSGRWIDEMFLKGMILFTAKWINLDTTSAAAKRFQAAMMADLEIDFERQDASISEDKSEPAALAAPQDRLGTLEELLTAPVASLLSKAKAPLTEPPSARHPGHVKPRQGAIVEPPHERPSQKANGRRRPVAPPAEAEPPFMTRAAIALMVDMGVGYKWMQALETLLRECPTMDDLAALHVEPSVVRNRRDAPAKVRSEIDALFRASAQRLGEPASEAAD